MSFPFTQPPAPQQAQTVEPPSQPSKPTVVQGSLAAFVRQPSYSERPPSISWKGAPIGATVEGTIVKTCTDQDVIHSTDPVTHSPLFYADGSPKLALAVQLQIPPSDQFPDGLGTLWVRGQMAGALNSALAASGRDVPTAGDKLAVTFESEKPSPRGFAQKIYRVEYLAQ